MEGTDEADADADKPVDTLWAADEALKSAVRDSRAVYATVTAALGRSVVQGHQQSAQQQDDEGECTLLSIYANRQRCVCAVHKPYTTCWFQQCCPHCSVYVHSS